MEQAIEWYVAISFLIVGLSHIIRPTDWAVAYQGWSQLGRSGAFVNGILHLIPGAMILAAHRTMTFPSVVMTGLGGLLVTKAAICLLAPDITLRSMERGGQSPHGFIIGGIALLLVSGWACFCLWTARAG